MSIPAIAGKRQTSAEIDTSASAIASRLAGGRCRYPAEQLRHLGARDQVVRQQAVERRQGGGGVGGDFDRDAACAEGDHRPECRIAAHADQEFERACAAPDHRLQREAFEARAAGAAAQPLLDAGRGAAQFDLVADVEAHAADVALVGHVGRDHLHHDRIADAIGQPRRLLDRPRHQRLRHRDAAGRQQLLAAGPRRASCRPPAMAAPMACVDRGIVESLRGAAHRRRLQQVALAALVLDQDREGAHRLFRRLEDAVALPVQGRPAVLRIGLADEAVHRRPAGRLREQRLGDGGGIGGAGRAEDAPAPRRPGDRRPPS